MPPQCSLDPMDCIFQVRHTPNHMSLHKRAPPPPVNEPSFTASVAAAPTSVTDGGSNPSSGGLSESDRRTVIIGVSVGGTLLLVLALAIFLVCIKRRRAARRIHQLQGFLPTFLDKDRTERYFREKPSSRSNSIKKNGHGSNNKDSGNKDKPNNTSQLTLQENASNSTLVVPPSQAVVSNLHNRTKSAPLARHHSLEKQGSAVFQQVLLDPNEQQESQAQQPASTDSTSGGGGILGAIRRTISVRTRQASAPVPATDSGKQPSLTPSSPTEGLPSVLIGEKASHPLPERRTSEELLRFAEGEDYHLSAGRTVPSSVEHQMNRFSNVSSPGSNNDMLLDPNRFSTMSVMFDARQFEDHQLQQGETQQLYYQQNMATTSSPGQQSSGRKPHPHHHRSSGLSRQSTESTSSTNSSDDDNAVIAQLPDHQKLQSFHAPPPLTSPGMAPPPLVAASMPMPFTPGATQQQQPPFHGPGAVPQYPSQPQQPYFLTAAVGGATHPFDDKQELDEEEDQPAMLLPTQPQPPIVVQPVVGAWPSSYQPSYQSQPQSQQNLQ